MDTVRKIIQRDYDEAVYDKLLILRYRLERFLKLYDVSEIENVFNKLSDARKSFVKPIYPNEIEYVRLWKEQHRGNQNSFPQKMSYTTVNGENVRSKSEKIIADLFYRLGIPYCYEPRIKLDDGNYLCPDFALLNVKERRTVYWEHFGLLSDEGYADKTFRKLNAYEKSGIVLGKDILFSMEAESIPLDLKLIEHKARFHLL